MTGNLQRLWSAKDRLVRVGLAQAREKDQMEPVHTTQALRTLLLDEMMELSLLDAKDHDRRQERLAAPDRDRQ